MFFVFEKDFLCIANLQKNNEFLAIKVIFFFRVLMCVIFITFVLVNKE